MEVLGILLEKVCGGQATGQLVACGSHVTGPPQCFKWPAETFRKNLESWNFLQISTVNAGAEANLNRDDLFLFPIKGMVLR